MKGSASRSASILVLGCLYLGLLLKLEGKVKGKGRAEAQAQGETSAALEAKGEWNLFSLDLCTGYRETVTGPRCRKQFEVTISKEVVDV